MCFPPDARPPDIALDLHPISGGASGEDIVLTSADSATFRSFLATAPFFDRTFANFKTECDDAWRQLLGLVAAGERKAAR